jgi:preprotein translocase subunit SecG
MQQVLLAVHLVVALALIGLVMLQRSEGGALGIGGGGGGNLFSSRGVGNTLTRATAILAACFFATSVALTMLANHKSGGASIINTGAASQTAPVGGTAPAPAAPSGEGLLPKLDPNKPVVPTN